MRTHVMLDDNVVGEVDILVGRRKRSRFVEEAIREKLAREKLLNALKDTAGVLSREDHPEWDTPEKVAAWVRDTRRHDMERLRRLPHG
ncbi:MAG: hypothetical protein HW384_1362 [Dehalococcoidia bacterium]|nr:hypothetical protein [Dehalococcoidia bacterium]